MIRRGDIRWLTFSRPDKCRPVLVLGRESSLSSLSEITVIPCSTQIRSLEWEVLLTTRDGLPSPCVLKPEWIKTVDRKLVGPLLTTLPPHRWIDVRDALLLALGLKETE